MSIEQKIAQEILQIYESGKRGIVLITENHRQWEPVVELLHSSGRLGKKKVLQVSFSPNQRDMKNYEVSPAFFEKQLGGNLIPIHRNELQFAQRSALLAVGLSLWGTHPGVGMILLPDYHLMDNENKFGAIPELARILSCPDGPLLLLTVCQADQIPEGLLPYVRVIRGRKPSAQELREHMDAELKHREIHISDGFRSEIVSYLQGFHGFDIPYLFSLALQKYGDQAFLEDSNDQEHKNSKKILELLGSEKGKMLDQTKLLEWKMVKEVSFANMDVLKEHLDASGEIMRRSEEAKDNGVDIPKGILILGVPGTGKSLFAHYAAFHLKMPLVRLDMGRMMGGLVGDSERNLRNAQQQAEEMAPCILWIDEIEKGFAGADGKGREEGAYLQRMVGSFLTWLQEKQSSCYVIATANSNNLPPEFFRKGRFDECFYTAMPTEQELREILKVHLSRSGRFHVCQGNIADRAIDHVLGYAANDKKFMTGADAAALVSNTFRRMFLDYKGIPADKQAYDREHLDEVMFAELKKMKVFSETNARDIGRHAKAARTSNFVNASRTESGNSLSHYDRELRAFVRRSVEGLDKKE